MRSSHRRESGTSRHRYAMASLQLPDYVLYTKEREYTAFFQAQITRKEFHFVMRPGSSSAAIELHILPHKKGFSLCADHIG